MKRLFTLAIAIFSLTAVVSAQDYAFLGKLNEKTTFNGIVRYLDASYTQQDYLQQIFDMTSAKYARSIKNGQVDEKAMQKTLAFNLAHARNVLTPEQYRKYLMVVNITASRNYQDKVLASK
ncbi:hypothetical protein [Dysgonomonas sp. 520]|uniref:hypothetical protein n=1 Tax=Dysgonomonas sp. 520 TaxID=2302931 RepID=UPI0013D67FB5|nr:hypothetical protein [Dysgonomonas sp. 520]NDW10378.1 hypothetical protein [Dysgonomonas sp. 520]